MSATNRGAVRQQNDDYPTPHWAAHRLVEACPLPGGLWMEPCSGGGSIIRAVNEVRNDVVWLANEINQEYEADLNQIPNVVGVRIGDVMQVMLDGDPSVIITNPPFAISEEVLRHLLKIAPLSTIIFLQRINWCESTRSPLFRKLKPSVYALPQRPSFRDVVTIDERTGKKRVSSTDATAYAWFVFDGLGKFVMLEDTPEEIRRAEKLLRRRKNLDSQNGHVVEALHTEIASAVEVAIEDEKAAAAVAAVAAEETVADENATEQAVEFNLSELFPQIEGDPKMAWLPPNMAAEVANSEAFTRGNRAKDGDYIFMHLKSTYEKTQKGMAVIIEHQVVSATKTVEGVEPNAVGTTVTYFLPDYGDAKVMLQPNLKLYVCGLLGVDPKTASAKDLQETIEALGNGLARGMYIRGVTFHTTKRNSDEDFMGFNWYPVAGENKTDSPTVQARKAQLGSATAVPPPVAQTAAPQPPSPTPPAPPAPVAAKFAGWTQNPSNPAWWYRYGANGQVEQKQEHELAAGN